VHRTKQRDGPNQQHEPHHHAQSVIGTRISSGKKNGPRDYTSKKSTEQPYSYDNPIWWIEISELDRQCFAEGAVCLVSIHRSTRPRRSEQAAVAFHLESVKDLGRHSLQKENSAERLARPG
jgi:hypothetical protein